MDAMPSFTAAKYGLLDFFIGMAAIGTRILVWRVFMVVLNYAHENGCR